MAECLKEKSEENEKIKLSFDRLSVPFSHLNNWQSFGFSRTLSRQVL
jgi:hypothetical protein